MGTTKSLEQIVKKFTYNTFQAIGGLAYTGGLYLLTLTGAAAYAKYETENVGPVRRIIGQFVHSWLDFPEQYGLTVYRNSDDKNLILGGVAATVALLGGRYIYKNMRNRLYKKRKIVK